MAAPGIGPGNGPQAMTARAAARKQVLHAAVVKRLIVPARADVGRQASEAAAPRRSKLTRAAVGRQVPEAAAPRLLKLTRATVWSQAFHGVAVRRLAACARARAGRPVAG